MIRTGTLLDLDMTTLVQRIAAGWRWWTGELAGMLPPGLSTARRKITLPMRHWQAGHGLSLGAAVPSTIIVPPELVLIRTVELPFAPMADLRQLVLLDLDRLTPFSADTAYCAVEPQGTKARSGTRNVQIAVIPKTLGRDIAAAAREAGVAPGAIGVVSDNGTQLLFDFAPLLRDDGVLPKIAGSKPVWWSVVAMMFIANLALYIHRDIASVARLQALVDAQASTVGGARRVTTAITQDERSRDLLIARRQRGNALGVLALTAHALPAGAWLERMSWSEGELRLNGYKQADLDLLKALRQSGRLKSIRSTTADAATEAAEHEPFDVSARIEGAP